MSCGKMEKCKVVGCNNRVMKMKESGKAESMKGTYGYCQIHNIEGLAEEVTSQKGVLGR